MATVRALTLLDLVQTINEFARNDAEVVAAVTHLINSGKVRLGGHFAGARIDLSTSAFRSSSFVPPGSRVAEARRYE